MPKLTSLDIAQLCAQAADHRKGEDIIILDLSKVSSVADYFILVSGQAEPHLKAIRNEIEDRLHEHGVKPRGVDGFPQSQWVVMDFVDVIVHIFAKDCREFYGLERLWGDSPRVAMAPEKKA